MLHLPLLLLPRPIFFLRRASRVAALAGAMLSSGMVGAQLIDNLDWKESEVPPPPSFSESRLVPIEMPVYMSLKFGVDPATISVTGDGVVRYVVVASQAGGATNAFYEGVRCATEEVKSYARFNNGVWTPVTNPEWKPYKLLNSRYAPALATQGLCRGHAPRASVNEMVRMLRQPVREVE
ncbi:MAG: CNP1-like family protein [Burkholderiaceae bacterium]